MNPSVLSDASIQAPQNPCQPTHWLQTIQLTVTSPFETLQEFQLGQSQYQILAPQTSLNGAVSTSLNHQPDHLKAIVNHQNGFRAKNHCHVLDPGPSTPRRALWGWRRNKCSISLSEPPGIQPVGILGVSDVRIGQSIFVYVLYAADVGAMTWLVQEKPL